MEQSTWQLTFHKTENGESNVNRKENGERNGEYSSICGIGLHSVFSGGIRGFYFWWEAQ